MNIVFLLRPWPVYGGGETVTRVLANEFVGRGHEVAVLFTRQTERKASLYINDLIKEVEVPHVKFDEHTVYATEEDMRAANRFLLDYCKKNNVDVIINQWWPKQTLKGLKEISLVLNCLHTDPFKRYEYENKKWKGRDLLLKLLGPALYFKLRTRKVCKEIVGFLPYVHKYLFLSQRSVKEFFEFSGKLEYRDQIDYCSNPLTYERSISEDMIGAKKNYVLFVGRMYEDAKKVSKVLDAWKRVENEARQGNWTLLLVGDGPDLNFYQSSAQKMGLVNYEFLGYQAPQKYLEASKLFLMTSTHEGWPMTLAEAKQNGVVPIVRDTFAALDEMVQDGVTGRIIDANNPKAFAEALRTLMLDDRQRVVMAKECLRDSSRFSVKTIADKWESIFSELQSGK